jgi:putative salt-induced outer membrane protein YdiY
MRDGMVYVTTEEGEGAVGWDDVRRVVPSGGRERDLWSGKLSILGSSRSGNTDQSSFTSTIDADRRSTLTRLKLGSDVSFGRTDGEENVNNQSIRTRFDVFWKPRLFWTPIGFELYKDRFKNIDLRFTPYTGLGYTLIDASDAELIVIAGAGYRWTRFDSAEENGDDEDRFTTAILGFEFESDLTQKIEIDASYTAQVPVSDLESTNQNASFSVSIDVWDDFDIDISFTWDRIGDPQSDAGGEVPEKDDFRLDVGIGWEF